MAEMMVDHALRYATELGWCVFPVWHVEDGVCQCKRGAECHDPGKHPMIAGDNGGTFHDAATNDPDVIRKWWKRWPKANIGLACGERSGVIVIDVDAKCGPDGRSGREVLDELLLANGARIPDTAIAQTGGGGTHIFLLHPGRQVPSTVGVLPGIDSRGDRSFAVLPPSNHHRGTIYEWEVGSDPFETPIEECPEWWITSIGIARELKRQASGDANADKVDEESVFNGIAQGERDVTLYRYACSLRSRDVDEETAIKLVRLAASVCDPPLPAHVADAKVRSAWRHRPGINRPDGSNSLESVPTEPGRPKKEYPPLQASTPEPTIPPAAAPEPPSHAIVQLIEEEFPRMFNLTDLGNAERLAYLHGDDLRYCAQMKKWLYWDGRRWKQDLTDAIAMQKAQSVVRQMYADAGRMSASSARTDLAKWAIQCEKKNALEAMVGLVKSMPKIAIIVDDLDRDDWLLNVRNGTIDLKSGNLKPHDRADLITKLCDVDYDPDADCSTWITFLERIIPDREVQVYLMKALGYTLTGSVHNQCLFFAWGQGSNGKSTMFNIVQEILGDYGRKMTTDTIAVKRNDTGPQNEIARLAGARFALTSETEEGKAINESLIKDLTGNDTVSARFLYAEIFEFRPKMKIWMYGNHKPRIRGTDKGIWRRIKLVEFGQTISEEEKDVQLLDKLRIEAPGILAWMVQGCLLEQDKGLTDPASVTKAVQEYRVEMDTVGAWISDCVEEEKESYDFVNTGTLYTSYKKWCEIAGEHPVSMRRLSQILTSRGWEHGRNPMSNNKGFKRIILRPEE